MRGYPAGSIGSDISALQEAGHDTSDVGRGSSAVNAASVGRETGCSSSQAARAGHDARNDFAAAGDMGVPADRHRDR